MHCLSLGQQLALDVGYLIREVMVGLEDVGELACDTVVFLLEVRYCQMMAIGIGLHLLKQAE